MPDRGALELIHACYMSAYAEQYICTRNNCNSRIIDLRVTSPRPTGRYRAGLEHH